jgi:hypothetical protein
MNNLNSTGLGFESESSNSESGSSLLDRIKSGEGKIVEGAKLPAIEKIGLTFDKVTDEYVFPITIDYDFESGGVILGECRISKAEIAEKVPKTLDDKGELIENTVYIPLTAPLLDKETGTMVAYLHPGHIEAKWTTHTNNILPGETGIPEQIMGFNPVPARVPTIKRL